MFRILFVFLLYVSFVSLVHAQPYPTSSVTLAGGLPPETYIDETSRHRYSLNGMWEFAFDTLNVGVFQRWFDKNAPNWGADWIRMPVPGTWDLHHPHGYNRQTVGWYKLEFYDQLPDNEFHKLMFEGVFREATVWLNGEELGGFSLPYLPFGFDITHVLKRGELNTLVVRIDNRLHERSLPASNKSMKGKHGWFPYGGIIRDVYIESGMGVYCSQVKLDADADGILRAYIKINRAPVVTLQGDLKASAQIDQIPIADIQWHDSVRMEIYDTEGDEIYAYTAMGEPFVEVTKRFPVVSHWSTETPENVYTCKVHVFRGRERETNTYEFGFKRFQVLNGRFYLNGKDMFLRGINRHEDHPTHGPVYNETATRRDMELIQEMGANFCRLGHYPNDVRNLQAFRDAGLMTVEEIPVYQLDGSQMAIGGVRGKAKTALELMIIRDFNQPNIVMWSLANEIRYWTRSADGFMELLCRTAKGMDAKRPVMTARLTLPESMSWALKDRSTRHVDVVGVNSYFGWHYGNPRNLEYYLDQLQNQFPKKSFFLSEYGAGAVQGNATPFDEREDRESNRAHSYSEAYQSYLHKSYLKASENLIFIRGVMPWVLADFRIQLDPSTGNPHPVSGMNLKGLVSKDRIPKDAFQLYKEYYQELKAKENK